MGVRTLFDDTKQIRPGLQSRVAMVFPDFANGREVAVVRAGDSYQRGFESAAPVQI